MKKQLLVLLLLPFCLLLMGCPYKDKNPIDTTHQAEDKLFTGTWTDFQSPEKTYVVRFSKEGKYIVTEKKKKKSGAMAETTYYGTISNVSGTRFLNLYDTSKDDHGYYIYKITDLTAAKLILLPLSGTWLPVMKENGQLKQWLTTNKDRANFYDPEDMGIYVHK